MVSRPLTTLSTVICLSLFSYSIAYACDACSSTKTTGVEAVGINAISEAIKTSPSSVIAFHSGSCGTCKIQKPRLQSLLLKEQNSQIKDVFLDFDAEVEIRKNFKVAYPSTVIVFKNGLEVGRVTGETNEAELQKLLNKSAL
jgi:thioredoxin-like negative regulator of GroEL